MKNTQTVAAKSAATTLSDALLEQRLSPHFTLREFTLSGVAIRHGIENTPSAEDIERLRALCENVLEPLRRRFGVIRITSGYRSETVNRLVGGVATSQHRLGEAADIHISNMEVARKMCDFARQHLHFDQLIMETVAKTGTRWLHVSYREGRNRQQILNFEF